jgi:GntR family transcriptional repressor for pyruvate dehydrogenase complex
LQNLYPKGQNSVILRPLAAEIGILKILPVYFLPICKPNINKGKMKEIFNRVDTQTVRTKIVDQFVNNIKEGKFLVGDQLPSERIIAEQMGVSRPTVREAIAILNVMGLVETRTGLGNYIKSIEINNMINDTNTVSINERSPFEILETRKCIEAHAAFLAAERGTPELILEIGNILQALNDEVKRDKSWDEEADRCFHISIAKATENGVLVDILNTLMNMSQQHIWMKLKEIGRLVPETLDRDVQEHREIYEAIKSRDAYNARDVVWKHFSNVERDIFGL